jgi:hypothetical protein
MVTADRPAFALSGVVCFIWFSLHLSLSLSEVLVCVAVVRSFYLNSVALRIL